MRYLINERDIILDPITGLVSYPSFQNNLTQILPKLVRSTLSIAIGDVDNLSDYVLERRFDDPTMFGHLAGYDCMSKIGYLVRTWETKRNHQWPELICSSFGGDEIIIAALNNHNTSTIFIKEIEMLSEMILSKAPRPCSFAVANFKLPKVVPNSFKLYRHMISKVDRELFNLKKERTESNKVPYGIVIEVADNNLSNFT